MLVPTGNNNYSSGLEKLLEGVLITVAVKGNTADPETGEEHDGYILEKTYDSPIGITSNGKPYSKLKVVLGDDGFIVTTYPVK